MSPIDIENKVATLLPLVEKLERIIETETDSLVALDTNALDKAVQAKREGLSQLALAWRQSGLERMIQNLGVDGAMQLPAVATLARRVQALRERNEVAGGAIGSLLRSTREALGSLGITGEPQAYGASGQGAGRIRSRTLGVG